MKFKLLALILVVAFQPLMGQNKYEHESKISREEFPQNSLEQLQLYLKDAKRVRFYQETDSLKKSYEAKFKKGRLHYSVEFDANGDLEDVEFTIKVVDIPEDSWLKILTYLRTNHDKHRVKKIQQQYINPKGEDPKETLRKAFQNLILPEVNYELVFSAKTADGYQEYEGLFDSTGKLIALRKSYPPNYDHILY